MSTHTQIILCTCPDFDTAHKIAHYLVTAKLAACINILPAVTSVYEWQGQIETAQEQLLLIKSCQSHYPSIEAEIKRLHPYELPEVIAIAIENGFPDYLKWINSCLLPE
jgi:periplasmic divalent cation tolerance protein